MKWNSDNEYLYAFTLRYPNGKEGIVGYKYKSRHITYLIVSVAKEINNNIRIVLFRLELRKIY